MSETENLTPGQKQPAVFSDEKKLTYRLLLKAVVAISSLFVIILLVAGFIIDRRYSEQKRLEMDQQVETITSVFESIMLDDSSNKKERAQAYLEKIGQDTIFNALRMVSLDTTVVFSKDSAELGKKLNLLSIPDCKSCHALDTESEERELIYLANGGVRTYHFVKPIENLPRCALCHLDESKRRGTLVVDFSLAQLDKDILATRVNHLMIFMFLLVVVSVSVYFLLRLVAYKPLVAIAGRLKRIAGGDFSKVPSNPRSDLTGFIGYQIDETASQLERLYEDLELRVEERTQSLRESQDELEEEKNKLQFILEHSPQGLVGLTKSGQIRFANRQFCKLVGANCDALLNRTVDDFELLRLIFNGEAVRRALSSSEVASGVELVSAGGDDPRYLEVSALTVSGETDESLLVMLADITEKRQMMQNQERNERLASIGQLAAGVAHEVGNPLAAISSLVQITQKISDPEKQSHNLDLITYHIDRIRKIVRNLSDFARVPDERMIATDIIEIVRGAIEIASFDARAKDVSIKFNYPPARIMLEVRRDQLVQAILNVIINAFDAMEDMQNRRLSVLIESRDSDKEVVISVTDNGEGIRTNDAKQIFEPFYSTKPVGKGTGLGLSVTHRIITDMGGEITARSRPGEGATFLIKLPRKRSN